MHPVSRKRLAMSSSPSSFQKQQISKPSIFRSGVKHLGGIALIAFTVMTFVGTSPTPNMSSSRRLLRKKGDAATNVSAGASPKFTAAGYTITEYLGEGSSGIAYGTDQGVVVKISKPGKKDDLLKEAKLLRDLESRGVPNITHVYRVFGSKSKYDKTVEMVFESAGDTDIKGCSKVSLDKALNILKDVATTLTYVNDMGILHLDSHWGNVMFSTEGAVNTKLIDWGRSKGVYDTAPSYEYKKEGNIFGTLVQRLLERKTNYSSYETIGDSGISVGEMIKKAKAASGNGAKGKALIAEFKNMTLFAYR